MYILLAFGVAGIMLHIFYKHIQKILSTSIKSLIFKKIKKCETLDMDLGKRLFFF